VGSADLHTKLFDFFSMDDLDEGQSKGDWQLQLEER
jgi:hypothetical protein